MTFRVGQKVVCVDDLGNECLKRKWIKCGAVYTIKSLGGKRVPPRHLIGKPYLIVNLCEIYHPNGWAHLRFRPAVERKTDISIFTAMLNPSKVEA